MCNNSNNCSACNSRLLSRHLFNQCPPGFHSRPRASTSSSKMASCHSQPATECNSSKPNQQVSTSSSLRTSKLSRTAKAKRTDRPSLIHLAHPSNHRPPASYHKQQAFNPSKLVSNPLTRPRHCSHKLRASTLSCLLRLCHRLPVSLPANLVTLVTLRAITFHLFLQYRNHTLCSHLLPRRPARHRRSGLEWLRRDWLASRQGGQI